MVRWSLTALLSVLVLAAVSASGFAGEAEPEKKDDAATVAPEKKPVDESRSVSAKLAAARRKLIGEKPELAQAVKEIKDKRMQLDKDEKDLYAKMRTMSPEIDELEKRKEALDAEKKQKQEEERKAREANKPKRKAGKK